MARRETEIRRMTALKYLAVAPDGAAGSAILYHILVDRGYPTTRDQFSAILLWLDEQELVNLRELEDGAAVATITERGKEVASGLSRHPGITGG